MIFLKHSKICLQSCKISFGIIGIVSLAFFFFFSLQWNEISKIGGQLQGMLRAELVAVPHREHYTNPISWLQKHELLWSNQCCQEGR